MVKAVFFDFFNTISHYEPSREQVYVDACKKHGIELDSSKVSQSLAKADIYWRDKNRQLRASRLRSLRKFLFYLEYVSRVINGSGVKINKLIALDVLLYMRKINWKFILFEDVIPTLRELKNKGYTTAIISNVDQDFKSTFENLGFLPFVDAVVTSAEAGCEKPSPQIFKLALDKAGVKAEDAVYIGDQFEQDIMGALSAGMQAILIDRYGLTSGSSYSPRISTLEELFDYI